MAAKIKLRRDYVPLSQRRDWWRLSPSLCCRSSCSGNINVWSQPVTEISISMKISTPATNLTPAFLASSLKSENSPFYTISDERCLTRLTKWFFVITMSVYFLLLWMLISHYLLVSSPRPTCRNITLSDKRNHHGLIFPILTCPEKQQLADVW